MCHIVEKQLQKRDKEVLMQTLTDLGLGLASLRTLHVGLAPDGTSRGPCGAHVTLFLLPRQDTEGLRCVNRSVGGSQALRACFAHRPGIGVQGREKENEAGTKATSDPPWEAPRHAHKLRTLVLHAGSYCDLTVHMQRKERHDVAGQNQSECSGKAVLEYLPGPDLPWLDRSMG